MTVVQQLYDLLGIDEDTERHTQALADIEHALADNHLLVETRQAVEGTRIILRQQETVRKDMELIVETSQGKASQVETKLYGGTVRNPRELEDLQTELNMLREHQRQQEESLLQALEALEETEKALNDLEHNLHEIEATRQKDEKRLVEEMTHLRQEVALLEGKRQSLSALVSPAHLQLYGTLRSSRHGQAVVKVERGMCQGCRIGLPTRTVQLARTSANPVQCPSCNRILYVS